MLEHAIVAGLIPQDGEEVRKSLNEASAKGYQLLSTTCCAIDEHNAFYIATFGLPVAEPKTRRPTGIGMSGGGSIRTQQPSASDVNASPDTPSENS